MGAKKPNSEEFSIDAREKVVSGFDNSVVPVMYIKPYK